MCNRNRVDAADRRFEFTLPSGSYATALLRAYLQRGSLDR
jgi:tRNA(Glu) U13 pseudouridine synthase TruD